VLVKSLARGGLNPEIGLYVGMLFELEIISVDRALNGNI
jgi:hypothetical protein